MRHSFNKGNHFEVKAVAVDLDGTMIDSAPDLAAAANLTLKEMKAPTLSVKTIVGMIGDGIDTLLKRCVKESIGKELSIDEMERYRQVMRGFYAENVFTLSRIYPGVVTALEAWRQKGIVLACITNKASELTLGLLEKAELMQYFHFVYCADIPEQRKPAPEMIHTFLSDAEVDSAQCIMIGDSSHDLHAAERAGVQGIAVTYGYGNIAGDDVKSILAVDSLGEIKLTLLDV